MSEYMRAATRWNVIDVGVAIVALSVAWSGYAVFQVSSGRWRQAPMRKDVIPVDLLVRFIGLDGQTAREIRVGDAEVDKEGREIARVVEVETLTPEMITIRFGDQDWIKQVSNTQSGRVDVAARLRVLSELRGDVLYYNGRLLGSGARLGFHTSKYAIGATVYDEGWVRILVSSQRLPAKTVQELRPGRKERDLDGRPLAKILRIETISPEPVPPKALPPKILPPPSVPSSTTPLTSMTPPTKRRSIFFWGTQGRKVEQQQVQQEVQQPAREDVLNPQRGGSVLMWVSVRAVFYNGTAQFKGVRLRVDDPLITFKFGEVPFLAQVREIGAFKTPGQRGEIWF